METLIEKKANIKIHCINLDKNVFTTPEQARRWVEQNEYDTSRMDDIGAYYTFFQIDRSRFNEASLQNHSLGHGIVSVIGQMVDTPESDQLKVSNTATTTFDKLKDQQHRLVEVDKLTLTEMTPENLSKVETPEVVQAWHRLNEWYSLAVSDNRAIEDYVNAAVFVISEMDKRGIAYDKQSELAKLSRNIGKSIFDSLEGLPKDIVVVRDFISVVGSTAKGKPSPNDLDVVIRSTRDKDNNFLIQSENVWLPVRNVIDPEKEGKLHWIDNPQGAHGDFIALYDLVLRKKEVIETTVVKGLTKIDLGCGLHKATGFIGLDSKDLAIVDKVCDLSKGIPYPDNSVHEVRASHFVEHLEDKEAIMSEIHRVLIPGGLAYIEVPSTSGEGAFNHPDHKSYWNKSSFYFWTNPNLLEGRPKFNLLSIEEEKVGNSIYVKAWIQKPVEKESVMPLEGFLPPKPEMAGYTDYFTVSELWDWAKDKLPVSIEPKWNGFRCIVEKKDESIKLWFEGQIEVDQFGKVPDIANVIQGIPGDFILDCDLGIEKNGKRLPRPKLMKLNSDSPEFAEGETPVLQVFDLIYLNEDIHEQPFSYRREKLEALFDATHSDVVKLSPLKWCENQRQLNTAAQWAFDFDRSEGLVSKSAIGTYSLSGATNEWAKIKKVVELKVRVLDIQETRTGDFNYSGGIILGDEDIKNTVEVGSTTYVDLGKTFNTKIKASKGDILTVEVLELIPDDENKTLVWLGARVIDKDDTRTTPYAVSQAIDLATRFGVIQKSTLGAEMELVLAAMFGVQIKKAKAVDLPPDEGSEDTRGGAALRNWNENWVKLLPSSGKGRYVYQHHWRGLAEDQTSQSERQLLKTDHSVHGDLRLEGDSSLFGFSVFLGTTDKVAQAGGDRLVNLKDDTLQGTWKLPQPKEWLNVGRREPAIVPPGGVGSTSNTWSKFFAYDYGTFEMGYAKQHFIELFFHGRKMNGRYVLEFAPIGENRIWVIKKPEDQDPYLDKVDLVDEFRDQKSKGRRWIYVSKPGMKPVLLDLSKDTEEYVANIQAQVKKSEKNITKSCKIIKALDEKQLVYGVVLEPESVDLQGDIISAEAIEDTAHRYMKEARVVGLGHDKVASASVVESWIAPVELNWNRQTVKKGSWVLGVHVADALTWKKVKDNEYNSFSVGGFGWKKQE